MEVIKSCQIFLRPFAFSRLFSDYLQTPQLIQVSGFPGKNGINWTHAAERSQLIDKSIYLVVENAVLPSTRVKHISAFAVGCMDTSVQGKATSARALVATNAVKWPLRQHTSRHLAKRIIIE